MTMNGQARKMLIQQVELGSNRKVVHNFVVALSPDLPGVAGIITSKSVVLSVWSMQTVNFQVTAEKHPLVDGYHLLRFVDFILSLLLFNLI